MWMQFDTSHVFAIFWRRKGEVLKRMSKGENVPEIGWARAEKEGVKGKSAFFKCPGLFLKNENLQKMLPGVGWVGMKKKE